MASEPIYDVIVVGSGAAGGISAYVLATQGLKVLCLEAGRMLDPGKDFYTHKMSYEWPYRGVVDASCFVTHPEKPITHTIMALAYRASDHLAEEFRLGNV